jgi:hypothetical protein
MADHRILRILEEKAHVEAKATATASIGLAIMTTPLITAMGLLIAGDGGSLVANALDCLPVADILHVGEFKARALTITTIGTVLGTTLGVWAYNTSVNHGTYKLLTSLNDEQRSKLVR